MKVPSELRFTKDHEWVRLEGNFARVGITDYAQDALGDVVFVDVPVVGKEVKANESFSEVESTKSVSSIYAPVNGKVVQSNDLLAAQPELVNSDPYGDGWLCVIECSDLSQTEELLEADAYIQLTEN